MEGMGYACFIWVMILMLISWVSTRLDTCGGTLRINLWQYTMMVTAVLMVTRLIVGK